MGRLCHMMAEGTEKQKLSFSLMEELRVIEITRPG